LSLKVLVFILPTTARHPVQAAALAVPNPGKKNPKVNLKVNLKAALQATKTPKPKVQRALKISSSAMIE
jgi:hypothetical protein